MRLITSMDTAVDGQGAALNECLAARFVVASVGAFIGMYSEMALEISLASEILCNAINLWLWSHTDCLPLGNLRIERGERPCR